MNPTRNDLQFPDIRFSIQYSIKELADREYQLKNWVNPNFPHPFWNNLSYGVHTLFDDSMLVDYPEPENHIGRTVVNQEELTAVFSVMEILRKALNKIGYEQPDSAYINSPLWDEVIKSAQKAYEIFVNNDELYEKKMRDKEV